MLDFESHPSEKCVTGPSALHYSRHAVARMQQRGIRKDVADLIVAYGDETPEGNGRSRYAISRHQFRDLHGDGIPLAQLERAVGTCVIVAAGTMITGYRGHSRHIRRSAKDRGKRAARRRRLPISSVVPRQG